MKIQLITRNREFSDEDSITVSDYSHPMSPDDFDINVIDLACVNIWHSRGIHVGAMDVYKDLGAISKMISDSVKSKIVYVYPQDGDYQYGYDGRKFQYQSRIKDLISDNSEYGYKKCFSIYAPPVDVVFEPTKTKIGNIEYSADFRFTFDQGKVITKSDNSCKTTTLKVVEEYYFTTLDICSSVEKLLVFINTYLIDHISNIPDWVKNYEFYNDFETKTIIESSRKQIEELTSTIEKAESTLSLNNRYKSILFTNGDELVEVIFEMLEKILDCDLSGFIDVKKEDFKVQIGDIVFIGEIKGINTNVKNGNISQLDYHYHSYLDESDDDFDATNVHAILIINPLRSIDINEREPVNKQQIDFAKRNGSLIIETITLLKMFELYLNGELSTKKTIEVLTNKTGILSIEDFQCSNTN